MKRTAIGLLVMTLAIGFLAPPASAHGERKQSKAQWERLIKRDPQPGLTMNLRQATTGARTCMHQKAAAELATAGIWWNRYWLNVSWCFNSDGTLDYFQVWPSDQPRDITHWDNTGSTVEAFNQFEKRGYARLAGKYELCFWFDPLDWTCVYRKVWISASVSNDRKYGGIYYADFDWNVMVP